MLERLLEVVTVVILAWAWVCVLAILSAVAYIVWVLALRVGGG